MDETYTVDVVVPEDVGGDHAGETVTLEVGAEEYLLDAAREAGLWLEADCRQGWCTRCGAKLLEGTVDHGDARRYYDVDEEAGFVLTCRAKPVSDCRLRAFRYEEILDHRAAYDLPPGRSKR